MRLVALRHTFRRRLGWFSIRLCILCVKQHNRHKYPASSCIHSASCAALRSSLSRKTELAATSQLRPSARAICCEAFGSAMNIPPQDFFQNPPQQKEVALTRWRNERYAAASGAQSFGFAKCSSLPPPPLRLFRVAHIKCNDSTSCSRLCEGACHCRHTRAAMVSPTASRLCRQSHAFRAERLDVFVAVTHGITLVTGPFAVTCGQRSPSLCPATCSLGDQQD